MRATAMRTVAAVMLTAAASLPAVAAPASAGPMTGSTELLSSADAGSPLEVGVTLSGVYPVVAYDFVLENRCWFGGRYAGKVDSVQSYPLLGPWYSDGGGGSYSQETVDLAAVPQGAACKVAILRGSSPVKGSSSSYDVG
jgi:hypothetical protein